MIYNKHNFEVVRFSGGEDNPQSQQAVKFCGDKSVATNGHFLVECEAPKNGAFRVPKCYYPYYLSACAGLYSEAFTLSTKDIKRVKFPKLKKSELTKEPERELACITPQCGKDITVSLDGVSYGLSQCKADFPDVSALSESLNHENKPLATVVLDVQYLKAILDFASKVGHKHITINLHEGITPVEVFTKSPELQNINALVMPITQ